MLNRICAAIGLVVLAVGVTACDRVPLMAPTGASVALAASNRVLETGGLTEVTAMVLESSGTPVQNGTTVRFTTTLGRMEPVEAQTRNGIATTTFYAGDASGTAEIRATSGGASSSGSSSSGGTGGTPTTPTTSSGLSITVGAAAVDSLSVQVNPTAVSFNGGTVDVVATVLGVGGRFVPGVLVTFSTTGGTLNPPSATTDANGQARSRLTTNVAATVTASAGGKTSSGTAAAVAVQPAPGIALACAVGATTNCSSVVAGQTVSFTAARATTTSTLRSADLDFGDGSSVNLGTLAASTVIPKVYSAAGNYTARLTATDINGETVVVSQFVQVLAPLTATVSATFSGRTATATATVEGGSVLFYEWTFEANVGLLTTTVNQASYAYPALTATPPALPAPANRTIIVKATLADGRTITATTVVVQNP